jgi:hypothetical protein
MDWAREPADKAAKAMNSHSHKQYGKEHVDELK